MTDGGTLGLGPLGLSYPERPAFVEPFEATRPRETVIRIRTRWHLEKWDHAGDTPHRIEYLVMDDGGRPIYQARYGSDGAITEERGLPPG